MGSKPMSFLTSHHTCPKKRGKTPHKGGCVIEGSADVFVGGMPVTTVGHKLVCDGPADTIAEGSPSVFVNGKPVARVGSMTVHGGKLVEGNPTVMVGDAGYVGTTSGMKCLADLTDAEVLAIEEEHTPQPVDSRPQPYKSPTGPGAKRGASNSGDSAPIERIEEEEEEQEVPFEEWLHVEVLGEEHPEGHSLKVMTREYGDVDAAIDGTHAEEKTDDSVIHKWRLKKSSEKYAAKVAVAMEIDTEEGGPIRLPVFDSPFAEPRKKPRQEYILAPFVPLTTIERQGIEHPGVVTCRAGYLYIFRHDMLWREIKIVRDENGELTYRDVALDGFREAPGELLSEDRRETTGVELEEVWVPVEYRKEVDQFREWNYRVAYSEVQWSAARIHYLEHNVRDQEDRAQIIEIHSEDWTRYRAKMIPLSYEEVVPPLRPRERLMEELMPCAYEFLSDLSGSYAKESYETAREEQEALRKAGKEGVQAWKEYEQGTMLEESAGARWSAFEDLRQIDAEQFDSEQSHEKLWTNVPAVQDVLDGPRGRKIYGLVVYDELYEVRLRMARVNYAMNYQSSIRGWLSTQTHFQSAELIEQTLLPVRLGGGANPLREFRDKLDMSLDGTFSKTLHQHLRVLAINTIMYNQERLWRMASQGYVQRRFADLMSLEGEDYLSGFMLAGGLFEKMQHDAEAADKPWLAKAQGDTTLAGDDLSRIGSSYHLSGSRLILDILKERSGHPLHTMLTPSEEVVPLDRALDTTTLPTENPGDGSFRPALFAAIGGQEKFSPASTLQTTEARMLVELEDDEADGFTPVRLITKTLEGIAGKIMGEFNKAYEIAMRDLVRYDIELNGPLARALKGMHPFMLGEVIVQPYGEKSRRMLPLGVDDPEIGLRMGLVETQREYVNNSNRSGRFFGKISTADGSLEGHTNPQRLSGGADPADFAKVNLFMAPAGSALAKNYRKVREGASRSLAIGKTMDSMGLPYIVMGLELWNISGLSKRAEEHRRNRSDARADAEVISAYAHLSFALATVVEQIAGKENWLSKQLGATVLDVEGWVKKELLSKKIAAYLPRVISVRMVSVSILGAIDGGIRISDSYNYWQQNQIAASGAMGVAALGSLMSTWAGVSLMNTGSMGGLAAVFGLSNPAGWLVMSFGIVLSLGGSLLATRLEKGDLELWIENGPFGFLRDDKLPDSDPSTLHEFHAPDAPGSEKPFAHIRGKANEEEAFYRLANILAGVTVKAEKFAVSDELAIATAKEILEARGKDTTDDAVSQIADPLMSVNIRIRVRSNLVTVAGQKALEFDVRRLRMSAKMEWHGDTPSFSRGGDQPEVQSPPGEHWWVYEVALPDGTEYWLHSPAHPTVEEMKESGEDEDFFWIVRARLKTPLGTDKDYVFPAPPLHDNYPYDESKHGSIDFIEKKDFWINEIIDPDSLENASEQAAATDWMDKSYV